MTEWRTGLAKDIHKRNLLFYELKEIVDLWRHENKRKPILISLNDLFREVNDDLNGDILKPHACETIDIDSELLSDIIFKATKVFIDKVK